MNPSRHVIIAMTLTALIIFAAGDGWSSRIKRYGPVKAAEK